MYDLQTQHQLWVASEQWREGFGVFDTEETLNKAALTSPLKALEKCLGVKLAAPADVRKIDGAIIASRKQQWWGMQ